MIRAVRIGSLMLLAVVAQPVARAAAVEHRLTLAEAIESALAKNESIMISRESLGSAESAVLGARGAYDPLLQVDAGWNHSTPPINSAFSGAPAGELAPTVESVDAGAAVRQLLSTGGEVSVYTNATRRTSNDAFSFLSPSYDTAVGVEVRQPLLRGRAVDSARRNIRVASADRDRSEAQLRLDVTDTVALVERAYWILVALREAVAVRQDAVRLAQEQLEQTRARIETGLSPETELAQPRAELERRRGDLFATLEAVSRAENNLKVLILSDSDADLWSSALVPVEQAVVEGVQVDVAASIEQALAARPELTAAEAFVDSRGIEREFARNQVQPSLDAVVSYDRYGLAGSLNPAGATLPGLPTMVPPDLEGGLGRSYGVLGDGGLDDARVGLVFTIPIRNRTAKSAEVIARSAERQATAQLERTRKIVRAEVLDAAAAVDTTFQRVEAARAAVDAAVIQLEAEQDRFDAGLSTNFLVLTRQNDLEGRRIDEISARTDYLVARTEMARATGTLLQDRGIEVFDTADVR